MPTRPPAGSVCASADATAARTSSCSRGESAASLPSVDVALPRSTGGLPAMSAGGATSARRPVRHRAAPRPSVLGSALPRPPRSTGGLPAMSAGGASSARRPVRHRAAPRPSVLGSALPRPPRSTGRDLLEPAIGEDLVFAGLEQRLDRLFLQLPQRLGERLLQRDHRSEEHTSELQSHVNLVCRLLLEK